MKSKNWFDVDRAGLRELHGALPLERLVMELVQNSWDENSTSCQVSIRRDESRGLKSHSGTRIIVTDDNPAGFKNLTDAFTLFRTTAKRSDPEKRGRFNFGEKLVLARAESATIASTTGAVVFDQQGRHTSREVTRLAGSRVSLLLKGWSEPKTDAAIDFLGRMIVPAHIAFSLNGNPVPTRTPELTTSATLATEILSATVHDGGAFLTRTARKTVLGFYEKTREQAYLYELGIPVCPIAGEWEVDVRQKIPLSQDRTTVPEAYLQDIYAELVKALGSRLDPQVLGTENVAVALADERVDASSAHVVFQKLYGEKAVIQSHDIDADQEAARAGYTIVPSRTFGSAVNTKLREGGVTTSFDVFGKKGTDRAKIIPRDQLTPEQKNFLDFAHEVASVVYPGKKFSLEIGTWNLAAAIAFNQNGNHLVFHASRVPMAQPFATASSLVLHELAHTAGNGHDGVYDFEFESLVNRYVVALAKSPERFRRFDFES